MKALALFAATAAVVTAAASGAAAAPGLHRFTSDASGFDTNSYYYDTGKEVVVFDAQFTEALARRLLGEIKRKTKSPVRYVVITHPNPDKFNGATVLQRAGAKIVASAATAKAIPDVHAYKKAFFTKIAKMMPEEAYPPEPKVDVTFRDEHVLALDGGKVALKVLENRGVSTTQTVAYIPAEKALVVGDLVHHKTHAWLEGGIEGGKPRPDVAAWTRALDELTAYEGATVYGGRGDAAPVATAVTEQKAYLEKLDGLVAAYVRGLGAKKAEIGGPQTMQHCKRIAERAKASFPDYKLPYLVEYGVYGLAGAKASN
jgi:glyoxylase-like metal-dependent hydrolase (beta-lactamase superfamily II)